MAESGSARAWTFTLSILMSMKVCLPISSGDLRTFACRRHLMSRAGRMALASPSWNT